MTPFYIDSTSLKNVA